MKTPLIDEIAKAQGIDPRTLRLLRARNAQLKGTAQERFAVLKNEYPNLSFFVQDLGSWAHGSIHCLCVRGTIGYATLYRPR